MEATSSSRFKDVLGIAGFIVTVLIGALLINTFIFRSYSVNGPSMEETLHTNDRLIVNRLPLTWSLLTRHQWVPDRGQVVVLKNPLFRPGQADEYLVKRVIGLPGETVVVKQGKITVYNQEHPEGFNPDASLTGPKPFTSGDANTKIPEDSVFVIGDNRVGNFSFDSRNGLGTIQLADLQGPVALRIYPFDKLRAF